MWPSTSRPSQEAVASDPDAAWRVVTIHQDIYGTGLDHSDTDGMILRTQLTPIFDEYDIDVVLQGHDHTYSRSKLLYGDGQTHGTYEFQLNADGSDYDWDHAYNTHDRRPRSPCTPEEGRRRRPAAAERFPGGQPLLHHRDHGGQHRRQPQRHAVHDRQLRLRLQIL